jgi:hypothetical protein
MARDNQDRARRSLAPLLALLAGASARAADPPRWAPLAVMGEGATVR